MHRGKLIKQKVIYGRTRAVSQTQQDEMCVTNGTYLYIFITITLSAVYSHLGHVGDNKRQQRPL